MSMLDSFVLPSDRVSWPSRYEIMTAARYKTEIYVKLYSAESAMSTTFSPMQLYNIELNLPTPYCERLVLRRAKPDASFG